MAAVNASRNRFIVCRQCLKIRGDTRRMRVILGPSIRGFLLFELALSLSLSGDSRYGSEKTRSPVNRHSWSFGNRIPSGGVSSPILLAFFRGCDKQENGAIETIRRPLSAFPPSSRDSCRNRVAW